MWRHAVVVAAVLSVALAPAAPAQDTPSLELAPSPELEQRMRDAPGELAWGEVAGHLTVRFTAGEVLDRAPIQVVAVAVRGGQVVGRSSTPPGLASAGQPKACSELAGAGWPPVERWFPASRWSPTGMEAVSDQLAPDPEEVASRVAPSDADGGVVLFAAPAADELQKRFTTRPLVVRMRSTGAAPDSLPADTTAGR